MIPSFYCDLAESGRLTKKCGALADESRWMDKSVRKKSRCKSKAA